MDAIIKILRFAIAIIICGISTKVLTDLLHDTKSMAQKVGNVAGTLFMYYVAYLVVRKYFWDEHQ